MSANWSRKHPQEIFAPGWHGDAKTPVVDGKYHDRTTGEVRVATGHQEYSGPPAVDIIVRNIHADTLHCAFRAARPFPVEALLQQMMQIIHDRKLDIDSLTATQYAIRVTLAHELSIEEFNDVASKMTNAIWDQQ